MPIDVDIQWIVLILVAKI